MKLTKLQLKEARSIIASENRTKGWAGIPKRKRVKHAKKMSEARWKNKKITK